MIEKSESAVRPEDRRFPASFFAPRWHGEVPLGQLFWQDMLIYGTAINIATALIALLVLVWDGPAWFAAIIYFSPVPYNLFLFAAVWKNAGGAREPWSSAARVAAFLWLIVAMLI